MNRSMSAKLALNMIVSKLKSERILAILFRPVYLLLFRKLGRSSFVSPSIYWCGLNFVSVGECSFIGRHTRLLVMNNYNGQRFDPELTIGSNVSIGYRCTISCVNRIDIGDDVTIGDHVYLADSHHKYQDVSRGIREQELTVGTVHVGRGAWIGYGAFLAGHIVIGEHAVVGSNSVVTHDVEPYTVVAGAPAKPIRRYCFDSRAWHRI